MLVSLRQLAIILFLKYWVFTFKCLYITDIKCQYLLKKFCAIICHGDIMIKEKRNQFGYTQEEMAEMLQISLRQYVRIDKETCLPRSDILDKLISTLDLTNEEIGAYVKTVIFKKCS